MMGEVTGTKSLEGASKPDTVHKERPPEGTDLQGKTWRMTGVTDHVFLNTSNP